MLPDLSSKCNIGSMFSSDLIAKFTKYFIPLHTYYLAIDLAIDLGSHNVDNENRGQFQQKK